MATLTAIPTRTAWVTVNNTDLDEMMRIAREDSTQFFNKYIKRTPLRTVEGLLAATKPLTTAQTRQLHLLGLALYYTARGRRMPLALRADKKWLEKKRHLADGHPLVGAYRDPRYYMWFQYVLCCLELLKALEG